RLLGALVLGDVEGGTQNPDGPPALEERAGAAHEVTPLPCGSLHLKLECVKRVSGVRAPLEPLHGELAFLGDHSLLEACDGDRLVRGHPNHLAKLRVYTKLAGGRIE